jgi:release factor glutamine methyltransferase
MATTVRQYLRDAITRLNQEHIDSPATTARAVLSHASGQPREWLVAHDDEPVDGAVLAAAEGLISRVLAHEPLAYILGHREFYGLDFRVDPRILIPRPETEMLVELALADLSPQPPPLLGEGESLHFSSSSRGGGIGEEVAPLPPLAGEGRGEVVDLIDVGTGSGAVAVAVGVNAPTTRVIATDISFDALCVARENAELNGVSERIWFIESDLLGGVQAWARVITANLPYVTVEEIEALPPEIQSHEPRVALDGGADGLALVRRLLTELDEHLLPGGSAYFEIGAAQGQLALSAARESLPGWRVQLRQDLARLDRVLQVTKPSASLSHES